MSETAIQSLVEKWLETGDDRLFDEVQRERQETERRLIAEHRLIAKVQVHETVRLHAVAVLNESGLKRYLHVHVCIEGTSEPDSPESLGEDGPELGFTTIRCCEQGRSVLVSVRQRVQDGNGVQGCRYAALRIGGRIELIDQQPCLLGNALHYDVPFVLVFNGVRRDRILTTATARSGLLGPGQSTDQVVERGSRIVDTVADENAQSCGWLVVDAEAKGHLGHLRIDLDFHHRTAAFEVGSGLILEDFQMFPRSQELFGNQLKV